MKFPSHARIVIIGGGVAGCSIAYHLTKEGMTDVVVLERKTLTSGTTWHAAGLVGQLRATYNLTQLAKYSTDLYEKLERETGQSTGFKQFGSLSIATSKERLIELKRGASMARCCGLAAEVITPAEARDLYPILHIEDLEGAVFLPKDGQINPIDVTQALAKGARTGGVKIYENVEVKSFIKERRRISAVVTNQGTIQAETVVICCGMWSYQVGRSAGVNIPLHACEHFYVVTEPMTDLPEALPVLRDVDACNYFKEDAGKLLIGQFEPNSKPWGMEGIPEDFSFTTLADDIEHIEPYLEAAIHRVPLLASTGIQTFFNGPESFTPDGRYYLGLAPELDNCYVTAGFNSIGIQSAGGAGMVMASWITHGHPPMDLGDVDIRRVLDFQSNRRYQRDRAGETLGLLYAQHWPFYQYQSARSIRQSPLHHLLREQGACFGETAGWERANWYAKDSKDAIYHYSYGRQNWFDLCAEEHRTVREDVGLLDLSSFAKFMLAGRDAESVLNRVSANNIAVAPGRVVYTQWLNKRGGIEADLTITRISENQYLIVTAAASQNRDFNWLQHHIPDDAHAFLSDVTSAYAVIAVMGPNSRKLMSEISASDISNNGFPYASSKLIEIGYAQVRATRISYMGELGWELYVPSESAVHVYQHITQHPAACALTHVGYHAMNGLRIEKAYRHFGHDITDEDDPLQSGMNFAIAYDKQGGFIGDEALMQRKGKPITRRLVQFLLKDPEPLLYHDEPIWANGDLLGRTTSGMYGYSLGAAVALGYINHPEGVTADFIKNSDFEIEIAGDRYPAMASLRPMYDPSSARMKV